MAKQQQSVRELIGVLSTLDPDARIGVDIEITETTLSILANGRQSFVPAPRARALKDVLELRHTIRLGALVADDEDRPRTAEARLQELLDQKDARIEQLEEELRETSDKLEAMERNLDHVSEHGWMLKRAMPAEQTLPVPRLELTIVRQGPEDLSWYYRLIYRDYGGDVLALPISTTRSRGHAREPITDGQIDLPLRDGVLIHHDMAQLRLPAYLVYGERVERLTGSRLRNDGVDVIRLGEEHRSGGL